MVLALPYVRGASCTHATKCRQGLLSCQLIHAVQLCSGEKTMLIVADKGAWRYYIRLFRLQQVTIYPPYMYFSIHRITIENTIQLCYFNHIWIDCLICIVGCSNEKLIKRHYMALPSSTSDYIPTIHVL